MQDNVAVQIGLPIAIIVIMAGIGLTLTLADFQRISQRPRPVLVGLAGHYLLLPMLGFIVAWAFALPTELAVGLVLVAACPSGSSSNALTYLARGNVALAVTLTVISALATFVSVPLLVNLALQVFGGEAREIRLPLGPTVKHLAVLVLIPVMLGMAIRRSAPDFARRVEPAIAKFSLALLLVVILVLVYTERATLGAMLFQVGPAALTMGSAAIGLGYLLGRGCRLALRDAITVGMEVGVQNATLAIVIALTLLNSPQIALPGAIYGLLMYLPALAMVALGRRAVAREEARAAQAP
ncbi:MAG: bile acid:sodium symporter family protein [Pseudomonadota bacterium]